MIPGVERRDCEPDIGKGLKSLRESSVLEGRGFQVGCAVPTGLFRCGINSACGCRKSERALQ
jgi:hypothetical protein